MYDNGRAVRCVIPKKYNKHETGGRTAAVPEQVRRRVMGGVVVIPIHSLIIYCTNTFGMLNKNAGVGKISGKTRIFDTRRDGLLDCGQ